MSSICATCGLPKEICACQTIEKETSQILKVYTTKARFNKLVTIVEGLKGEELAEVAKELKHKLACGGTYKDGQIVLQGNHREKVVDYLSKLGYNKQSIQVG